MRLLRPPLTLPSRNSEPTGRLKMPGSSTGSDSCSSPAPLCGRWLQPFIGGGARITHPLTFAALDPGSDRTRTCLNGRGQWGIPGRDKLVGHRPSFVWSLQSQHWMQQLWNTGGRMVWKGSISASPSSPPKKVIWGRTNLTDASPLEAAGWPSLFPLANIIGSCSLPPP